VVVAAVVVVAVVVAVVVVGPQRLPRAAALRAQQAVAVAARRPGLPW